MRPAPIVAATLLDAKADTSLRERQGRMPLRRSTGLGCREMAAMLQAAGAN